MTDEKLIRYFLDKSYTVTYSNAGVVINEKTSDTTYYHKEFTALFRKIFGDYLTDTHITNTDVLDRWVNEELNKLLKDVNDYLKDVTLKLDSYEWRMYRDGIRIKEDDIKNRFKQKFTNGGLNRYLEDWMQMKMIEITEKMFVGSFDTHGHYYL